MVNFCFPPISMKETASDICKTSVYREVSGRGWGGRGERRGLGPRNDVLTTCKAVTLSDGQRIIAVFYGVRSPPKFNV